MVVIVVDLDGGCHHIPLKILKIAFLGMTIFILPIIGSAVVEVTEQPRRTQKARDELIVFLAARDVLYWLSLHSGPLLD